MLRSRDHRGHADVGPFIMISNPEFIPENGGEAGIRFREWKGYA